MRARINLWSESETPTIREMNWVCVSVRGAYLDGSMSVLIWIMRAFIFISNITINTLSVASIDCPLLHHFQRNEKKNPSRYHIYENNIPIDDFLCVRAAVWFKSKTVTCRYTRDLLYKYQRCNHKWWRSKNLLKNLTELATEQKKIRTQIHTHTLTHAAENEIEENNNRVATIRKNGCNMISQWLIIGLLR